MIGSIGRAPRVIVVGSGAGGAAAARELQKTCEVTILEEGREFRPLSLSMRWMERLRSWGLLFDERVIRLVLPSMKVRKARNGIVMVNGVATGGTTVLSAGNALRMDESLRQLGIDLDTEFAELSREVPVSTAHQAGWSAVTRRLYQVSRDRGLAPSPTPKLVDYGRCRRCGRCVLGCPYGAKWDSRRFLDDAVANGAVLRCGWQVTKVVIRDGRAIGVRARVGARSVFLRADLVVLAAGGLGTPVILERSGIPCETRLFVDPVLCVAAPWPQSMQHHDVPMPFVIQRPGYIVSPYFDYLSFLFNRRWRHPAGRVLGLMIKLADSELGWVGGRRGRLHKGLTAQDRERLAEAETLCRQILVDFGVDPASIFTGTLNAGHPGGMLPLTAADAQTLHPARLPQNLYVADATLFPRSLGNPPILTILALARRVVRVAANATMGCAMIKGSRRPPSRTIRMSVDMVGRRCKEETEMEQVIFLSRGGNTRRVADAIAGELGAGAADVEAAAVGPGRGVLFLGSGCYGGKPHETMMRFIGKNDLTGHKVAVFGTSASGVGKEVRAMERALRQVGAEVLGSYHCKGQFLRVIRRGRPNEADLTGARDFAREMARLGERSEGPGCVP